MTLSFSIQVKARTNQWSFHPHQSFEDTVSFAPGTAVTSIHLVKDARLSFDGRQSPEKVRGRVDVVPVRTRDDVRDVTRTTADRTGGNEVHFQRIVDIRHCIQHNACSLTLLSSVLCQNFERQKREGQNRESQIGYAITRTIKITLTISLN